jgi:hypothetical protein
MMMRQKKNGHHPGYHLNAQRGKPAVDYHGSSLGFIIDPVSFRWCMRIKYASDQKLGLVSKTFGSEQVIFQSKKVA